MSRKNSVHTVNVDEVSIDIAKDRTPTIKMMEVYTEQVKQLGDKKPTPDRLELEFEEAEDQNKSV